MPSLYKQSRNTPKVDPFIDLLFNTLMGFSFLFLVSLLFINPKADQAKVEKQAEYIISATWPQDLEDDIDLWMRAPTGHTVSYLEKETGWLHLERDDRGELNDTLMIDGKEEIHPINQEIITIRKRNAGEYIVNLFYYTKKSREPVPVDIRVDRINPKYETVYRQTINLDKVNQEKTAVRFTIKEDGSVHNISKLPIELTPYSLDHMPSLIPDAMLGKPE
ncbi:hypothetical protein GCM10009133_29440 [Cocleimonas flava]|uniref:Uncharacterized protein n=1 Tax=Cocleimonas flava TaxID=634765 RepID=A0A4R1FEB9_9GAMM|nr:hypothetical protein [Cocleimonas flava]TCJ89211.1 hypothetical protein EV695_1073 [Cocleimonas flava]